MAYDYTVSVGADVADISSGILEEIKKADNSKIKIKCDDKEINKLLAHLSKVQSVAADRIEIDIKGNKATKTLTQLREDAKSEIGKIKQELSTINIDSLTSDLEKKQKTLNSAQGRKDRELAKYNLSSLRNSIKSEYSNLGNFSKGTKEYTAISQTLLNLVATYEQAGGKIKSLSKEIQTAITGFTAEGMTGKALTPNVKRDEDIISRTTKEIKELEKQINHYKTLQKDLKTYQSYFSGMGSGAGDGSGKGSGTGGIGMSSEELQRLLNILDSIEQSVKNISTTMGTLGSADGATNLLETFTKLNTEVSELSSKLSSLDGSSESGLADKLQLNTDATEADLNQFLEILSKIKETIVEINSANVKEVKVEEPDTVRDTYARLAKNEERYQQLLGKTDTGKTLSAKEAAFMATHQKDLDYIAKATDLTEAQKQAQKEYNQEVERASTVRAAMVETERKAKEAAEQQKKAQKEKEAPDTLADTYKRLTKNEENYQQILGKRDIGQTLTGKEASLIATHEKDLEYIKSVTAETEKQKQAQKEYNQEVQRTSVIRGAMADAEREAKKAAEQEEKTQKAKNAPDALSDAYGRLTKNAEKYQQILGKIDIGKNLNDKEVTLKATYERDLELIKSQVAETERQKAAQEAYNQELQRTSTIRQTIVENEKKNKQADEDKANQKKLDQQNEIIAGGTASVNTALKDLDVTKLGNSETVIARVRNKLEELNATLRSGGSAKEYNAGIRQLIAGLDKAEYEANDTADALAKMKQAAISIGADPNTFSTKITKNGAEFTATYKEANKEMTTFKQTYNSLSGVISSSKIPTGKSVSGLSKILDGWKGKVGEVFRYIASFGSIYQVWSVFQQGIGIIHELDDALTEMSKVSEESLTTLQAFQKESFGIADAVGSTGQQIQQSTADWQRLGNS